MSAVRESRPPHQSPCRWIVGQRNSLWGGTPEMYCSEGEMRGNAVVLNNWRKSWSHNRARERENVRESDFSSPVTESSDTLVAGSLSSELWLPECIRGPVCNLTSQYWNSNASSHSSNCCLVIGFQTCGTRAGDVLASSVMLCHGGWWGRCKAVKIKNKIAWK